MQSWEDRCDYLSVRKAEYRLVDPDARLVRQPGGYPDQRCLLDPVCRDSPGEGVSDKSDESNHPLRKAWRERAIHRQVRGPQSLDPEPRVGLARCGGVQRHPAWQSLSHAPTPLCPTSPAYLKPHWRASVAR